MAILHALYTQREVYVTVQAYKTNKRYKQLGSNFKLIPST